MTGAPQVSSYVLGEIFYHLCSDGPLPLRHVLFVSKAFFYAAINNAQLWTTISLDFDFMDHFTRRSVKHANGFIRQCLVHSGELPLCLRIIYASHMHMATLSGSLQTFMNPKYRSAERCTSLMLYGLEDSSSISNILASLPRELPSLKDLDVIRFGDPVNGSQFPNCPLLERVAIWNHLNSSPTFWRTSFAHVTTLSLEQREQWEQDDMEILLLFPLLHHLTLYATGEKVYWDTFDSQLRVQLEYLRILRVYGAVPSRILTGIVAPALEKLMIIADHLNLTSIDELLISFEPLCLRLVAFLPEGISVIDPMWATSFSKLVEKCTRLEELSISKWMEEECKKFIDHSKVALHVL